MEIGLRGILIIVGVIIIAAILFDGYRRARDSRKTAIKMSLELEGIGDDNFDEFIGELPGGGRARVISSADQLHNDEILFDYNEDDLNPQLTESLAVKSLQPKPDFTNDAAADVQSTQQDLFGSAVHQVEQGAAKASNQEAASDQAVSAESKVMADQGNQQSPAQENFQQQQNDEVLIISVVAKPGKKIQGAELLGGLFNCGLHYGSMNIFHRFSHANGEGPLMFSMANMIKPGIFDLDNINGFETPGVSFFLTLPGPKNSMTAFDLMLDTSRRLARILNAELTDQQQKPLSQHAIDDYRRRIREFERTQIKIQTGAKISSNDQASSESSKALT